MQKISSKIIALIAIIVVICLVGASYVAIIITTPEPEEEVIKVEMELDDRISPLTNQGVIIEINRIRHRGLLDKIMKIGTSWKNKPSFYFMTNMDGLEYKSNDVGFMFNDWDTMFQENKIVRDVDEEQETSEITLTIIESKKIGILKLRSQEDEKEKISITYDFKTGRWDGDDYFNDSDGYGHYVGDTFEVWFNVYQVDYDMDGIPYWTEVNVLYTDPRIDDSKQDPDGDGIPTSWEWKWGYNHNVSDNHTILDPDMDGLENIEEYKMAKWFADPFSQDIYIEVDGMEKSGLIDAEHVFWKESQQILIERFTQHGINVYIDDGWPGGPTNGGGEMLPHIDKISQDSGMMLQFYNNHFSDDRKGIFRYLVIAHKCGFCHPSENNNYDTMAVGNNHKTMITIKGAFSPRTYRLMVATSVMHELGHTLGVAPWTVGGCDNREFAEGKQAKQDFLDEWGNYKSVMSYYYIYKKWLIDYSDGTNGPGDVNDWDVFDLRFFQLNSDVIEDPGFQLPGEAEIGG